MVFKMLNKKSLCLIMALLILPMVLFSEENSNDSKEHEEEYFGIVPFAIPFYTPETSFGVGAALVLYNYADKDRSLRADGLEVEVFGTVKKQFEARLAGDKYFLRNMFRATGEMSANIFPSNFYGTGSDVKKSDKEEYEQNSFSFEGGFLAHIFENMYIGPYCEFSRFKMTDTEDGGLLDRELFRGSDGTAATGFGGFAEYDNRDSEFFPRKGFVLSAKSLFYRKQFGSEYNFSKSEFDYKQFFNIAGDHVIGVEGYLYNSFGDVPWQKLGELGGQELMRGYEEGKFRDKTYAAAQIEYRFPIIWRLTGSIFASAGNVSDKISNFERDEMKYSFGAGLRCILDKEEHIPLRLDFAMNKDFDEPSIYFGLLEAF